MGSFIKAIRPLLEKVATASAPVVTEAPVAKAPAVKTLSAKNI